MSPISIMLRGLARCGMWHAESWACGESSLLPGLACILAAAVTYIEKLLVVSWGNWCLLSICFQVLKLMEAVGDQRFLKTALNEPKLRVHHSFMSKLWQVRCISLCFLMQTPHRKFYHMQYLLPRASKYWHSHISIQWEGAFALVDCALSSTKLVTLTSFFHQTNE